MDTFLIIRRVRRDCQARRRKVRFIHYLETLYPLNRIVGKVSFTLGSPNSLTAKQLLENLGISVQIDPHS
jgi:hypothetical protein